MHISEHYPAFAQKTLLVLTNNELAKLFALDDREIIAHSVIETSELEPVERETRPNGTGMPDLDAAKQHRRLELYHALSNALQELTRDEFVDIILCVPEANKNELVDALHTDVVKHIISTIPKNLASMELPQVMRILFET